LIYLKLKFKIIKMDYAVSSFTLETFEEMIYNINIEVLKEVHKKFLSDLDFQELVNILENKKKKKFIIKEK
tara:strand:- start:1624 stop:1836 length:213 start_codon:yes stop_codon:yes gene_type:complete